MPVDQRMVGGSPPTVRLIGAVAVFVPLTQTSNGPEAVMLIRVTIRIQVPRRFVMVARSREPEAPEPPIRSLSFWTNIRIQGPPPPGFSKAHCWNVTFWL